MGPDSTWNPTKTDKESSGLHNVLLQLFDRVLALPCAARFRA